MNTAIARFARELVEAKIEAVSLLRAFARADTAPPHQRACAMAILRTPIPKVDALPDESESRATEAPGRTGSPVRAPTRIHAQNDNSRARDINRAAEVSDKTGSPLAVPPGIHLAASPAPIASLTPAPLLEREPTPAALLRARAGAAPPPPRSAGTLCQ